MTKPANKRQRTYIAIDLKSFFASVECVERGLDPLTTNLVVADESRTEKTICLAVSPSLKAYGIGGRARLFEAVQRVREVNLERRSKTLGCRFTGKSWNDIELKAHPDWEVDFIRAVPRMAYYIKYSTRIYQIYLKYIAPEDIHVYSIDEVFMDVTEYITSPNPSKRKEPFNSMAAAHNLARTIIQDIIDTTGITATAGIGTNMYLCKIAMDIVAKHIPADKDGVRIAELDEMTYRRKLWNHRPLTSFWRVGRGIAERLAVYGIDTMGKIARASINNEDLLYRLFGINAELLIDHAWGYEPCTIDYVKAYKPETNSLSTGQVLQEAYTWKKARVVVQEMAEAAALDLVDKKLTTNQLVLTVGYEAITSSNKVNLDGISITSDHYGRRVPVPAHGTANLDAHSSSRKKISAAVMALYDRIVNPDLLVRRLNLTINHVISEEQANAKHKQPIELDLFTDYETLVRQKAEEDAALSKERRVQETILKIKKQFGKNALLTGLNFADGATAKERNAQIGGHKA